MILQDLLKITILKCCIADGCGIYISNLRAHWFNCDYSKIIVIKYCDDLQTSVYKLLSLLDIENKNIELGVVNKTRRTVINHEFNDETIEWFKEYFKEDLNIFSQIKENSHSFKALI